MTNELCPDSLRTDNGRITDKLRTSSTDAHSAEAPAIPSVEADFNCVQNKLRNKVMREYGTRGPATNHLKSVREQKPPHLQTVDEWLEDYERRDFEIERFGDEPEFWRSKK